MSTADRADAARGGTLFLSVGGSPQPLRTAIAGARWDRVHFVVSDGSDGTLSSRGQVEDAEISYGRDALGGPVRGPGLRHLPAAPRDLAVTEVPPDDLDRALALIDAALAAELAAGRRVTVDYTGGTKTMTAALVLAGSAHEGVALQFMAGERRTLVQVEPGTERPVKMPGHLLGIANLFTTVRAFTRRRSYQAALGAVNEIQQMVASGQKRYAVKPPKSWRRRSEDWRALLCVLDLWDRFEHAEAQRLVAEARRQGARWVEAFETDGYAGRLAVLAGAEGPTAAICEDLWLNALRRADLGLYDDAIARLYRLAEAAVQARLGRCHGIPDTGRVPRARVPAAIADRCDIRRDPRTGEDVVALGLYRALELLAHLSPDDGLVRSWPREGDRFVTPCWQADRNRSILAHGISPLGREAWTQARNWFEGRRSVLWEAALGRPTAAQLPDTLP